jgi:opacity protein-like surface antigen
VFGFKIESNTWEINPGLRKIWTIKKRLHPYGGAGLAFVQAKSQRATLHREISDRDRSYGVWLGGGMFFRIGSHLDLGLALRLTAVRDFKIFNETRSGTSTHLALTIGWGAVTAPEK